MNSITKMICGFAALALGAQAAWSANIAQVNGRMITDQEVKASLSSMTPGQREALLRDPVARRKVILNLIEQDLLATQAVRDKLDQEPEFKLALEQARRTLLNEQVIRRYIDPKINASAAKRWFEARKAKFTTDMVFVQHILVNDEATARDMLKRAQAPNQDFNQLAEKFSKDPSAKNNRGDLGPITRNSPLVDEFKDAAFRAKTGEVVGPVRTDFGYHVIRVVDKKMGRQLEFDEVELQVKEMMKQEALADYLTNLKKAAKISIDEKAINRL